MSESLPDEDEFESEDADLEDEDDIADPDGGAESADGENDAASGDSVSSMAMLAATLPMGMAGRQPKPPGAVPNRPGSLPQAPIRKSASAGKSQAGRPAARAPGAKPVMVGKPASNRPVSGASAAKRAPGSRTAQAKGKGGNASKALETAHKELDTAQKAYDAAEKPHAAATKKMVASAKSSATGLKPFTDAVKKSTGDHKSAKKDHADHEKQQGELDKALTGDGLGLLMKGVDALKPWIDKIKAILEKLKESLTKAFEKALRPVADFFQRTWSTVAVPAFQKTARVVSSAFSAVGDVLGKVLTTVKKACAVVIRAVGEVLQKLDFTIPGWVPEVGGKNLGLAKIGSDLVEWSTKLRDGGMVRGPGGPREDKVPVLMSNGEFVVNAASTTKHLSLLRTLNDEANGIRSTVESGYSAASKTLRGTAADQARSLARSDRPQLVIAKPLSPGGDRLDRSLKVNINAPQIHHAGIQAAAATARKSATYSGAGWR